MSDMFQQESRRLQDRFDTRRLADRLADVKVHDRFTADDCAFIESRDMFFIATVDHRGQPTCSHKAGDPGFVTVVDDRVLAFPSYDGNGMYLTAGNVAATGHVGLLFIDFERQLRVRVDGLATLDMIDPILGRFPGAQFIVKVRAHRVYPNCSRYIHKYQLVGRSPFVPRLREATPVPAWKRADWAADVLPSGDPARREE